MAKKKSKMISLLNPKAFLGLLIIPVLAITLVVAQQRTNPSASAATVPSAPTNFTVSIGSTNVVAKWTPSASDGGSPITYYSLTTSPGGITSNVYATSTTLSFPTSLLKNPGTLYTFSLVAKNALGSSTPVTATAMTSGTALPKPGAPTGFTAKMQGGNVLLNWTAPVMPAGAPPIAGYRVFKNNVLVGSTWSKSYTVTGGFLAGTKPTFKVFAYNLAGDGAAASTSLTIPSLIGAGIQGTGAGWTSGTWIVASIRRGQSRTWTANAVNAGTKPAVLDIYPAAGLSLVAGGPTAQPQNNASRWTRTLPSISPTVQPGQSYPFTITITVPSNAPLGTQSVAAAWAYAGPAGTTSGINMAAGAGARIYLTVTQ